MHTIILLYDNSLQIFQNDNPSTNSSFLKNLQTKFGSKFHVCIIISMVVTIVFSSYTNNNTKCVMIGAGEAKI